MKKILNIGLLIAFVGLAVLFFILDPAKHNIFPRCIFNSITGYYCPGCGSQRAIHSLLHFDIAGVVSYNFLFIPAFLLIIYHYLHPILKQFFGWKLPNIFYFKSTPWIIFGFVIAFWILRNLPFYPFSVLAPG
ncbi:MAG TPA: DUF2752 domain-containing protein [Draconibacterium sp.]|nr:DUF2752 domain-containing protein [Draconibacterium sp.]